jgi:hypothetical protein
LVTRPVRDILTNVLGDPEVNHHDVPDSLPDEVIWLDVAMNNLFRMNVLNRAADVFNCSAELMWFKRAT